MLLIYYSSLKKNTQMAKLVNYLKIHIYRLTNFLPNFLHKPTHNKEHKIKNTRIWHSHLVF